ncbi:NAD-dependent epimerase/dehydratase family protein [Fusibacter paucivorans]|uniref:NAD-dependent epimerase/dehydratase family protein n=1 Tax=Fusibacter paucivorans TaxID=76009 RepID=A0ABS5PN46_9FIRM|nr:NAD-dependent epimerase/dehydratase family protein [Fusibacter paucivorans]
MTNKKVLVTGGLGYIGKIVVKELLDAGHCVMIASSSYDGMDLRAVKCPESIFSGAKDIYRRIGSPDVCIHLAWTDGFVHNSPEHMKNLSNHIVFCEHMMSGGLPVLSCMGTMHEIGYWEGEIDEDTPCNPQSQYGIAKNAMRQSLLLSSKDFACTLHWLRLYYIVSNDIGGKNIFAKMMQAAQAGKKNFPFTSGKNLYDFMEINELARLIVVASMQTAVKGVTNICTGIPETLASRVEQFISDNKLPLKLDYGQYPDRAYDSPGMWGNATKIKQILSQNMDTLQD